MENQKGEFIDLTPFEDEVKQVIDKIPENLRQVLLSKVQAELLDGGLKGFYSIQNYTKSMVMNDAKIKGVFKDKEYLRFELHKEAYLFILDGGGTVDEALKFVSDLFEDDLDRIREASKNQHARWHMKKAVSDHSTHSVQRWMFENGIVSSYDLTQKNTPYSQLDRLLKSVVLFNWLKSLETKVHCQDDRIKLLEVDVETHKQELLELKSITGAIGLTQDERIAICKNKGLTQQQTADNIGVSLRTVQRRWKEV